MKKIWAAVKETAKDATANSKIKVLAAEYGKAAKKGFGEFKKFRPELEIRIKS